MMSEAVSLPDFNSPIVNHARKDFPLLDAAMTVEAALERIRREGVGERVIYFFATDAEGRLVGVLPTRRLLTAPLQTRLEEIMVRRVVAIPASAQPYLKLAPTTRFVSVELTYRDGSVSEIKSFRR